MLKKLIFVFLFLTVKCSCPNESLEYKDNCYFFQNNTNEFAAAEIDCVGKGGHLVSIHDAFTNAIVAQEGGVHFHSTDFWIGLTDMMPEGKWLWTDGTIFDFSDWVKGEPKNVSGNNCAALSSIDGFWRTDDCYKTKPYVCKIEEIKYPIFANCPFPFIYFQPTHSCYGVGNYTGPLNWTLGEEHCQAFGAHLTSIHSSEEVLFLTSYVYIGHHYYWTGAFSNDGGNTWEWSDRSPWDFNPFRNGYPSLHQNACGIMWGSDISDEICSDTNQIICKKPLKK